MRVMTAQAILTHRRMLEQKWAALFRMALVAIVID
jgi:hypothetical protein